jgi:hypothetical protein
VPDSYIECLREAILTRHVISRSLLALKECLRSIARVPGCSPRPPFRQTKLTRILEEALAPDDVAPSGGGASYAAPRRGSTRSGAAPRQARATVMLINAAPAAQLEKMTAGSLRYGQLFANEINLA